MNLCLQHGVSLRSPRPRARIHSLPGASKLEHNLYIGLPPPIPCQHILCQHIPCQHTYPMPTYPVPTYLVPHSCANMSHANISRTNISCANLVPTYSALK